MPQDPVNTRKDAHPAPKRQSKWSGSYQYTRVMCFYLRKSTLRSNRCVNILYLLILHSVGHWKTPICWICLLSWMSSQHQLHNGEWAWTKASWQSGENSGEQELRGKTAFILFSHYFLSIYLFLSTSSVFDFQNFPVQLNALLQSVHPFSCFFFFVPQSHDKKMGAANDYHTSNLQLAKERSWLITSYNVQQPVLQAPRYIMLHW